MTDHDLVPASVGPPRPELVLSSRRVLLARCRAGLAHGIVLVTGEPGVGKSWLAGQLRRAVSMPSRWVEVETAPGDEPSVLRTAIGARIGLGTSVLDRLDIENRLGELTQEGHRFGLIVDEAHAASDAVLEEVRLLSNHLHRPEGFEAMLLVGQSPLVQRLRGRPLLGLETRLAAHVLLRPLDIDEAAILLDAETSAREVPDLDTLHRDARGNPRRLIRLARQVRRSESRSVLKGPGSEPGARSTEVLPPPGYLGGLGESKPPVPVAPHAIEVGWNGETEGPGEDNPTTEGIAPEAPPSDEPVSDHYASLQAWREWQDNQERGAAGERVGAEAPGTESEGAAGGLEVWIDARHDFAPYGQLFSRARRAQGPESGPALT